MKKLDSFTYLRTQDLFWYYGKLSSEKVSPEKLSPEKVPLADGLRTATGICSRPT
jgi:hypothetical protein